MDCYTFGIEQTIELVAEHIDIRSSKILDVGAGRGRLSQRLREQGAEVTAIDKSPKAISLAADAGIVVEVGDDH